MKCNNRRCAADFVLSNTSAQRMVRAPNLCERMSYEEYSTSEIRTVSDSATKVQIVWNVMTPSMRYLLRANKIAAPDSLLFQKRSISSRKVSVYSYMTSAERSYRDVKLFNESNDKRRTECRHPTVVCNDTEESSLDQLGCAPVRDTHKPLYSATNSETSG